MVTVTVLKVEADFMPRHYPELIPGEYFIPVKRDMSDLVEKIHWARAHDAECREICRGAKDVARRHSIADARKQNGRWLTQILEGQRHT